MVVFQQGRHRSKPGRLFTVLAVRAPPENTDVELQIKTRSSHPPKAVSSRKKQKGHFKFWVKEKIFTEVKKRIYHYSKKQVTCEYSNPRKVARHASDDHKSTGENLAGPS